MNVLIVRKENQGAFAHRFHFEVFRKDFLQKSPMSTARNDELKQGNLLNPIELISNKRRQFDIQKTPFFRSAGFLFTLFPPACLQRAVSWLAFVVIIFNSCSSFSH